MQLFYSYSSTDEPFRLELEHHLSLLKREGLLETWSFRDINAGSQWERQIDEHLNTADAVLLLVSANFISSRYCWEIELRRAIERADRHETLLIPIIVRPCDWQTAPFARFQALPEGAKAVTSWRPRDRAWMNVAAGIRHLIAERSLSEPRASAERDHVEATVRRIQDVAEQVDRQKRRERQQLWEARINLFAELANLYANLQELLSRWADLTPSLGLTILIDGERCIVATDRVRLQVEPSTTGRELLVKPAYYGRGDFAYQGGLFFTIAKTAESLRTRWRQDGEQIWRRELKDIDEWVWCRGSDKIGADTPELAGILLAYVSERHAKLKSPDPPANSR